MTHLDERVDDTDIGTGVEDLVEARLSVDQLQLVKLLVILQKDNRPGSVMLCMSQYLWRSVCCLLPVLLDKINIFLHHKTRMFIIIEIIYVAYHYYVFPPRNLVTFLMFNVDYSHRRNTITTISKVKN